MRTWILLCSFADSTTSRHSSIAVTLRHYWVCDQSIRLNRFISAHYLAFSLWQTCRGVPDQIFIQENGKSARVSCSKVSYATRSYHNLDTDFQDAADLATVIINLCRSNLWTSRIAVANPSQWNWGRNVTYNATRFLRLRDVRVLNGAARRYRIFRRLGSSAWYAFDYLFPRDFYTFTNITRFVYLLAGIGNSRLTTANGNWRSQR